MEKLAQPIFKALEYAEIRTSWLILFTISVHRDPYSLTSEQSKISVGSQSQRLEEVKNYLMEPSAFGLEFILIQFSNEQNQTQYSMLLCVIPYLTIQSILLNETLNKGIRMIQN